MADKYLMWFMRFGVPHLERQSTLEDCLDLAHMLEDADTYTYDQYGVLNCIEHVETGIIDPDEWDRLREEYATRLQQEYEEEKRSGGSPEIAGWINVRPPESMKSKPVMYEQYQAFYSEKLMWEAYEMLVANLGEGRVSIEDRTAEREL